MANEQIFVRSADGADGVYIIDPNAVVKDGKPALRYINQEDLMIYVEVKAFMNPKATTGIIAPDIIANILF